MRGDRRNFGEIETDSVIFIFDFRDETNPLIYLRRGGSIYEGVESGASDDVSVLGVFLRDGSPSWDRATEWQPQRTFSLSLPIYIDFRANKVYTGGRESRDTKVRKRRGYSSRERFSVRDPLNLVPAQ